MALLHHVARSYPGSCLPALAAAGAVRELFLNNLKGAASEGEAARSLLVLLAREVGPLHEAAWAAISDAQVLASCLLAGPPSHTSTTAGLLDVEQCNQDRCVLQVMSRSVLATPGSYGHAQTASED